MNVLDASVAIKWVLPEQDSDKALVIRDEYQKQIRELIAPDIFPVEVAHALTRTERRGLITPGDVDTKMADVYVSAPILHDHLPLLERAIEMSKQFRIGVYDCLYLALAEQEQCEFITADAQHNARSVRRSASCRPTLQAPGPPGDSIHNSTHKSHQSAVNIGAAKATMQPLF